MSPVATRLDPGILRLCYLIAIRDNWTLEVREIPIEHPWGPASVEWWVEGAMSCDCARGIVFEAETGVSTVEGGGCEKRGRFTALWADLGDLGRVALDEPLVLH